MKTVEQRSLVIRRNAAIRSDPVLYWFLVCQRFHKQCGVFVTALIDRLELQCLIHITQ